MECNGNIAPPSHSSHDKFRRNLYVNRPISNLNGKLNYISDVPKLGTDFASSRSKINTSMDSLCNSGSFVGV